ncbi:hypothetical protein [Sphingorhabdus sp.]|jgi:hypothetical protein|uniref:hypothetical protein n=1 Tax=Sphingorhabdus sp. TaxID=1902408 RepID=UPI0037CAF2A2
MATKYFKLNTLVSVDLIENLTLFQAVENWLDRERDQLPLWLPVGIGFGIAIWQSGGTSIWIGVLVTSIALGAYSLLIPLGSRFRQIVQIFSLTLLIGFSLIALRSEVVAQPILSVVTVASEKRSWTVLATQTANQVPAMEMAAACKRVDIVVSDRWLPQSCRPKWIKADRRLLEQSGGLAFYLNEPLIIGANDGTLHMPWVQARVNAATVQ